MPIASTPLTKAQFEYLQKNIVRTYNTVRSASTIALSGVQYIADMNVPAPEVDLIVPFNQQLTKVEEFDSESNFTIIAATLNLHAITRGATSVGTLSERLQDYLTSNSVNVCKEFAAISLAAGFDVGTTANDVALVGGGDDYPDTITSLTPATSDGTDYDDDGLTSGGAHGVTGGSGALEFSIEGTLPTGLGIIQSTGEIVGAVPNNNSWNGTYTFTVKVEDSIGNTDKANYRIVVS